MQVNPLLQQLCGGEYVKLYFKKYIPLKYMHIMNVFGDITWFLQNTNYL